ncbi:MAG: MBL fold metallo-hydrolase [Microscillaceae bacterium]|jgi:metallo-beta-lactamase family protein|nr:MBL fold metallo-hydrolase [Microscillaceae bacterium]
MKLTFWGATRQVTGSMFLLETADDYRILIDCGNDMERRDIDPKQYMGLFPFEASMVNAVLLTHAHIDHSGFLPNLIREGFEGQIYCTAATYQLTKILLEDAAGLNMHKIKKAQQEKKKKQQPPNPQLKELYLPKQVDEVLENFTHIAFNQRVKLARGVYFTLIPAGHLLGAAHIVLEIEENGQTKKIGFSGDLGRFNYPLLIDPQKMPSVDYLICESTYGNRLHQTQASPEEAILEIVQATCVDIPGRLIVPAFSVGRTQAMLYTLNKLRVQGKLPPIRIFTDSPLAQRSSWIYQKYSTWLNAEAQQFVAEHGQLFDFENLTYLENLQESKAVANYNQPCIIVSSSGMIQGGRIEHHVKENLSNPYATILMIGYAAEGTLGYELIHGLKNLKTKKREINVLANIRYIDVFSGHGDLGDLKQFIGYQDINQLKKLFLVHGEPTVLDEFVQILHQSGYAQALAPKRGEQFEL